MYVRGSMWIVSHSQTLFLIAFLFGSFEMWAQSGKGAGYVRLVCGCDGTYLFCYHSHCVIGYTEI